MDLAALTAVFSHLPLAILVFVRVSTLFVAGPILGEAYIAPMAKVLLSLAVTLILTPLAAAHAPPLVFGGAWVLLVIKEAMVGFSLGFFLQLYVQAVRFGGDLLNRHAGFSAAENFDPETQASTSPLGDLLFLTLLLLFFIGDVHHTFFAALARSYDLVPLGGWALTPGFQAAVAHGLNEMSAIAISLSFPVLAAIMAITAAEGVITRAVPQINVLHISFAVKTVVSLIVLYSGLPAVVAFFGSVLALMQASGFAVLGHMG